MSDRPEERKVFVGGIPFGVDQHVVKEDFMRFGEIEDVYLPTDRETNKLRGFAFVTFRNSQDAHEAAGAMHGRDYHGRQITVNIAKPRDNRPPEGAKGSGGSSFAYSRPRDYDRGWDDRQRFEDEKRGGRGDGGGYRNHGADERERDHHDDGGDRDGGREDRFLPRYTHGNSYDGTGRYGDRDPRPAREFYD